MAMYSVYRHPELGYETVKEGFSWPGFFLTFIWAFHRGATKLGARVLGWYILGGALVHFLLPRLVDLPPELSERLTDLGWVSLVPPLSLVHPAGLCIAVVVGLKGAEWLREHLAAEECEYQGTTRAGSSKEAIDQAIRGPLPVEGLPYGQTEVLDYEQDL